MLDKVKKKVGNNMKISVIKEIKNHEYRVGLTPAQVYELHRRGHQIFIEHNAGAGSGFSDEAYEKSGGKIVPTQKAWDSADIVIKVKEPQVEEYQYFRQGLIIYTYFHLASEDNHNLIQALLDSGVTAIAYETVELENGALPLLQPMSEIAGRMSIQIGAKYLEKSSGGRGVLLGGIPGVERGEVVIIGGGVVGKNAAQMALGLGAKVTIFTRTVERLRYLEDVFGTQVDLLITTQDMLIKKIKDADLLIGSILVPGAKAPKIVTETMVKSMKQGSVIVDVSIDQGGCVETITKSTTHDEPIYVKHGVLHYAVANIPGAVARTSTLGLTNATAPYLYSIADYGLNGACERFPELKKGINITDGHIVYDAVAEAFYDNHK